MTRPRPASDQITMEMPGQPGEDGTGEAAPDAVLTAMAAARLYALDPKEAIALILLSDPLPLALAACRLLGACLEGIDAVNGGTVNLVEQA
jgi:hypothetical protein